MTPDPLLAVSALTVRLGGADVLSTVDVSLAPGEVVAMLGPSGSGKTTLLGAVAGFVPVASGEISISGEVVSAPGHTIPPERRSIGFVFQSYALWPHLTARDTVAFPMEVAGMRREDARKRADAILASLGVADLAGRLPVEMSGGQQQRVGLARVLARNAALWLLDEPTAHLDGVTRQVVEEVVAAGLRERGAAAIYATHDPGEALGIADRVVLLRAGRVVQQGSPAEVYERPVDEWAARLTGPASVLVRRDKRVMVRPEWVRIGAGEPGIVASVRTRGPFTAVVLDTADGRLEAWEAGAAPHRVGDAVRWHAERDWPLSG
ncbi:MAG TPA: ABC transporter ATP-binding protein [Acidimicrobiia bacterium]|nr:ABC transporter ATP-binding protein [Acidimicrobiia bacterium]